VNYVIIIMKCGYTCSYGCLENLLPSLDLHCTRFLASCSECNSSGHVTCPTCDGDGQIETRGPCTTHTVTGGHYYCTSSSHHGNNVGQYHK